MINSLWPLSICLVAATSNIIEGQKRERVEVVFLNKNSLIPNSKLDRKIYVLSSVLHFNHIYIYNLLYNIRYHLNKFNLGI